MGRDLVKGVDGEACIGLQGPVPKVWSKQERKQSRELVTLSWAVLSQSLKTERVNWEQVIRQESSRSQQCRDNSRYRCRGVVMEDLVP